MHTKTLIAAAIAGSLVSASAIAQSAAPAPSQAPATQQQPTSNQSQMNTQSQMNNQNSSAMSNRSAADMRPIASMTAGQMLSDDLVGTRVYGANNENIGEINNLLLDREGRVSAVIIGVGGFLGIGEKNVAVPFSALEFVHNDNAMTTSSTAPADPAAGTAANRPAGTATTTSTANARATTTRQPDRVVLRAMTKADLEAAPKFDARMADGNSNTNRPATTAPSAPAPAQNR